MSYRDNPARLFALVVGAVLVIAGVLGFFAEGTFSSDESVRGGLFGIFDVNGWHNVVHLLTGLVALALARTHAREFALGFGVVYLVIAIWGFLLGGGESILSIVPVNTANNVLHLVLGLSGLAVYAATAHRREHPASPARPTAA
jgi:hypothetical protein